ncbi:hypothetical protein [Clostridium sp. B9]|uniref:hypothetical protein n=1 Tax=Clostridium sp. B9 TaxID=3423224 RepID=UPI003D2EA8E8
MENKLSEAEEAFIEKITEHLDRTTEEVKEALGRNRQQRKQYIKDQEKKRRAIRNLTPIQVDIMKEAINREKEKMERWVADNTMSFYSSVNSVLYSDFNFTGEQTTILWDKVETILDEDKEARKEFSQIDEEEWRRMEQKVNEFIKKELAAGAKQKEIVEKLKKEFPKLSTSMRVNAVKEVKENWNKEKKLEGKSSEQIIVDEFEKRQVKADEEIKAINKEEVKEGMIKQTCEGIEIHTLSIAEQLKRKLNIKASEEEKVKEELKELEKLIATKKEKINKIQEDMARMEEAFAILEPINI